MKNAKSAYVTHRVHPTQLKTDQLEIKHQEISRMNVLELTCDVYFQQLINNNIEVLMEDVLRSYYFDWEALQAEETFDGVIDTLAAKARSEWNNASSRRSYFVAQNFIFDKMMKFYFSADLLW